MCKISVNCLKDDWLKYFTNVRKTSLFVTNYYDHLLLAHDYNLNEID